MSRSGRRGQRGSRGTVGGRGSPCPGERVLVLDTTGFLAAFQLAAYRDTLYTTPRVVEEVRDEESTTRLAYAVTAGRVLVEEPGPESLRIVRRRAMEIGERGLSETDVEVAALALELRGRGCRVVVVTDDYSLQNLLRHLGLDYMPLRTRGIREPRRYRVVCPACGYVARGSERVCPVCGTPLARRRA